ncbi:hypothetical protein CFB84_11100 [Burkholderia aenigmatica]|uniref:Uncharacterized protein n=2 Tax=Burkholderia aenigmatica TaxID=2015348 RepID=A0A228HH00_9BURK|nr:hypothetical protein CFB84_43955 [Burkholderia aenigmatica]OXI47747.1 hypothetical protein CFB84_11100 [Burkholderia aenigmatica]
MSGKLEKAVGDGLAKLQDASFCVIECKGELVGHEWAREALEETNEAGKVENKNGKGRKKMYTLLKPTTRELGKKCHYLVGYARTKKALSCMPYWDFVIFGPHSDVIDFRGKINGLTALSGVKLEEMVDYLAALIEAGGESVEETELRFIADKGDGHYQSWKTTVKNIETAFEPIFVIRRAAAKSAADIETQQRQSENNGLKIRRGI